MADRRRASRFVLFERKQGVVRLMEDVYVERVTATESAVIAVQPAARGEQVLLEFPADRGRQSVIVAHVIRSSIVPLAGTVRHRVLLRVVHRFAHGGIPERDRGESEGGRMGVVVRRIPVRITEASAGGCLLESASALPDGAVGILELTTGTSREIEALRITRCVHVPGAAWPHRAGAEFLPLEASAPTSLRNMVARLEVVMEIDSPAVRTSSGPAQSSAPDAGAPEAGTAIAAVTVSGGDSTS
jgi:hypothetical protein